MEPCSPTGAGRCRRIFSPCQPCWCWCCCSCWCWCWWHVHTPGARSPGWRRQERAVGSRPPFGGEDAETYDLLERHAAGVLEPRPVALGPMPAGATESMRLVAEDMTLLLGLQLAVDDDRPLMYSTRFCAWRMGWRTASGDWDKKRASRVLAKLRDAGVISWVGDLPRSKTRLYAPLAPAVVRPGPEVPALGLQPVVQPGGKSPSRQLWTMHRPFSGTISGLLHPTTAPQPGITAPRRMPVGNCMHHEVHHRHARDAICAAAPGRCRAGKSRAGGGATKSTPAAVGIGPHHGPSPRAGAGSTYRERSEKRCPTRPEPGSAIYASS